MSNSGLTSLGPGRAAATAVDWPPSAGDPGGHDAGVTSHSVRSWCHPWFNSLTPLPAGEGHPRGWAVDKPQFSWENSGVGTHPQLGQPSRPRPPPCYPPPRVLGPKRAPTPVSLGMDGGSPGTAGHSCLLRTPPPGAWNTGSDAIHSRTGPAPAGQAKGRRVLGAGWPPAQPDKAAAGSELQTRGTHGLLSTPPLRSRRPSWVLSVGQGGMLALQWWGGWGLTRASRAQGMAPTLLLCSQNWDPGAWCGLSRNPVPRPPRATGHCPPKPPPSQPSAGSRPPSVSSWNHSIKPPCPPDLHPRGGGEADLTLSLAPSGHMPHPHPQSTLCLRWEVGGGELIFTCSCDVSWGTG